MKILKAYWDYSSTQMLKNWSKKIKMRYWNESNYMQFFKNNIKYFLKKCIHIIHIMHSYNPQLLQQLACIWTVIFRYMCYLWNRTIPLKFHPYVESNSRSQLMDSEMHNFLHRNDPIPTRFQPFFILKKIPDFKFRLDSKVSIKGLLQPATCSSSEIKY